MVISLWMRTIVGTYNTTLRAHIAPLVAGGVLDWKRRGAGKALIVADVERFREHLDRTFPAPRGSVNHGSSRVRAVGEIRSTKALGGLNEETVSVRAWSNGTLLREGGVVAAEEATRQFGIFTFVLRDRSPYTLTGPVALGENPDFFAYFETLNLRLPFCVFTNGRFSRRFLGWLAAPQNAEATFIHFGDYDPVGLDEYRRFAPHWALVFHSIFPKISTHSSVGTATGTSLRNRVRRSFS